MTEPVDQSESSMENDDECEVEYENNHIDQNDFRNIKDYNKICQSYVNMATNLKTADKIY